MCGNEGLSLSSTDSGQPPVGGDLAAEHRQQRRLRIRDIEHQRVVAGDGRWVGLAIVVQRPHAGIRPHHVGGRDRFRQVTIRRPAKIIDLFRSNGRGAGQIVDFDVGRADQREVALVRNHEHDALVVVLQDERMRARELALDDDMAALDLLDVGARGLMQLAVENGLDPGTGGIDDALGADGLQGTRGIPQIDLPAVGRAPSRHAGGAREDGRAQVGGGARVDRDQPRIVDPAIGVDKSLLDIGADILAVACAAQRDAARAGELFALAQMVVQKQPGAYHPGGPQFRHMRHHELERPDDVRRDSEQRLALGQRLGNEPELVVLEIAQPAMNQLRRGAGRMRGQIVLFAQQHLQPAPGRVARDPDAVDAAADDDQVKHAMVPVVGSGSSIDSARALRVF